MKGDSFTRLASISVAVIVLSVIVGRAVASQNSSVVSVSAQQNVAAVGATTMCTNALPTPNHKPLIGVYYFGIWSPAMYTDSTVWPNNQVPAGTVAVPNWWAGVADFYQKTGSAYQMWAQRTPNLVDFSDRMPVIGYYDDRDVTVLEKQIDQASAASIDFFNFYWYWNQHTHSAAYADGLKSFRAATNKAKMRFDLSIYTSLSNPDLMIPTADIPRVVKDLFDSFADPTYLRVNGQPVLNIGDASGVGDGSLASLNAFISSIKLYASQNSLPTPLVLTAPGVVASGWQNVTGNDGFECLTPGYQSIVSGDNYDGFVSRIYNPTDSTTFYPWLTAQVNGKPISACAAANLDERPREEFGNPDPSTLRYYANFTPYKFYQGLQTVASWQKTQQSPVSNILNIYAWNEWQEGGYVEPNARDGSLYLDLIQRAFRTVTLTRYVSSAGHWVTTQTLASPWSAEGSWKIMSEQNSTNSRIALYWCQSGTTNFESINAGCGGGSNKGVMGYLAANQSEMQGLIALYGCTYNGTDHYVSSAADCEESTAGQYRPYIQIDTPSPLGYVFPY